MTKKLCAILLCLCQTSWATITLVNHAEAHDVSGTTFATLSAPALNITTGNLVVVGVRNGTDANVPTSVTDTALNTYVHNSGADGNEGGTTLLSSWYTLNATGNASDVVKVTFANNEAFISIMVRQYSNTTGSFTFDTTANGDGAVANTITSGAFTTTVANELITAFFTCGSVTQGFSVGTIGSTTATNFLADAASGSEMAFGQDLTVSSIQTAITAVGNYTGTLNSASSVETFSVPAGGVASGFCKANKVMRLEE